MKRKFVLVLIMKKPVSSFLAAAVLAVFLMSCVSLQDRVMTAQERAQAQVLGQVTAEFHSWQVMHIPHRNGIKRRAYQALLQEARRQYAGNIDIRNIQMTGGPSGWQWLNVLGYVGGLATYGVVSLLVGNTQKITATGDVVLIGSAPSGNTVPVPGNAPGNAPAPGANF